MEYEKEKQNKETEDTEKTEEKLVEKDPSVLEINVFDVVKGKSVGPGQI